MDKLLSNDLSVALDVGMIASRPGTSEERAELLLEPLHRLVPFQAACILILDAECRKPTPLVSYGYDETTLGYLQTPKHDDGIGLLGLDRDHHARRLRDTPAGFRGVLAVGLFTSDGRYLGVLCLSTDDPGQPTPAARELIGELAPVIANAVDPLRSIMPLARMVPGVLAGAVLTESGEVLPLPGMDRHPLLEPGSETVAAAVRFSRETAWGSFLRPLRGGDGEEGHARLTVLACPPLTPYQTTAVVVVSPPGDLHGLTRRELQIAGLLIEGWPNQRIAAHLFIAERTVATHVEHILAKLGSPTRASAAVRALQYGLYVPCMQPRVQVRGPA
jgi:DNA-binding CsgD family transcriptional regulator